MIKVMEIKNSYRIGAITTPLLITTPPHENMNKTPPKNEY